MRVPFWMTKLNQLYRLVRESHADPIAGQPSLPHLATNGETAVTFIGHSSFFIQIAARNLLIDPVFATRLILLRRQRYPGLRISELPRIDAVLLTHAHMDHLNLSSLRSVLRQMRRRGWPAPIAVVPHGVEDLVEGLGFSAIHSLKTWESTDTLAPLTITLTPCKHWGARLFSDTHRGFGGYTLAAPGCPTVYHSGDSAYFSGFSEIGRRLHPQISLLPIGAYFPDTYRSVHTSPEEALQAFLDLRADTMIPMHYNTFRLGREPMDEPLPRLLAAATNARVRDQVVPLSEGQTWFAQTHVPARFGDLSFDPEQHRLLDPGSPSVLD